jgi:aminoglycoside phosphotransferase family enzyme/predicted kinase
MPTLAKGHPLLVQTLMTPEAYPERVKRIRMLETHVSYLFFTGKTVYKVKKPVDYGFLDFTTLEKRHFYCLQEVALNSRISPQVYLGVVPICEQDGSLKIEGTGPTVEYAVKMRQLRRKHALNELLQDDQVSDDDIRRVAVTIANFHKEAATGPDITKLGDLNAVRQNAEENFQQMGNDIDRCLSQEVFDDLLTYGRAFMDVKAGLFARRAKEGWVRDGHGDLHSANVFLEDNVHIIDCIEFNDRFRCLDVTEDTAFIAMDLDFYGRPDLSQVFVSAYEEEINDHGGSDLLDFFKSYRAQVRGMVAGLRLDDPNLSDPERREILGTSQAYYRLAHSYTQKVHARPTMMLIAGLSGTGKTLVSRELAKRWDMVHISSDITRKGLAGIRAGDHRYEAYEEGIYSPEFTLLTYESMYGQAREELAQGNPVVLDASFKKRSEREQAVRIARELGTDFFVIECTTQEHEVQRRLNRRIEVGEETLSDALWEIYPQQKADWQPIKEVPEDHYIQLDTTGSREDTVRTLLQRVFARLLSSS